MVEKYGLIKGDRECFEEQAEDLLSVSFSTLERLCEAMLCKALEECGMDDEAIREASDNIHELFDEMGEGRENQLAGIASLLEWRWIRGFDLEEEKW